MVSEISSLVPKRSTKLSLLLQIHVSLKRRFDCFATTFPPAPEQKTHSPSCDPSDQQWVLLLPFPPVAQGTTASPGPSHGSLAALEMRDTGGWDQEQPVPRSGEGEAPHHGATTAAHAQPGFSPGQPRHRSCCWSWNPELEAPISFPAAPPGELLSTPDVSVLVWPHHFSGIRYRVGLGPAGNSL